MNPSDVFGLLRLSVHYFDFGAVGTCASSKSGHFGNILTLIEVPQVG